MLQNNIGYTTGNDSTTTHDVNKDCETKMSIQNALPFSSTLKQYGSETTNLLGKNPFEALTRTHILRPSCNALDWLLLL